MKEFNRFLPVTAESDRIFGAYQFAYFNIGSGFYRKGGCVNNDGSKELPVICLRKPQFWDTSLGIGFITLGSIAGLLVIIFGFGSLIFKMIEKRNTKATDETYRSTEL